MSQSAIFSPPLSARRGKINYFGAVNFIVMHIIHAWKQIIIILVQKILWRVRFLQNQAILFIEQRVEIFQYKTKVWNQFMVLDFRYTNCQSQLLKFIRIILAWLHDHWTAKLRRFVCLNDCCCCVPSALDCKQLHLLNVISIDHRIWKINQIQKSENILVY